MDYIATLCYEVARPKKSPAKIDKGPIQDPAEGLKIQGVRQVIIWWACMYRQSSHPTGHATCWYGVMGTEVTSDSKKLWQSKVVQGSLQRRFRTMGNTANTDTFVRQWRKPTLERYKKSGGHNLPNMVGIGLTDLPKNIVGQVPPAPPPPRYARPVH